MERRELLSVAKELGMSQYELVVLATKRARQLLRGEKPLVKDSGENPTIIALEEIIQGFVHGTLVPGGPGEPEQIEPELAEAAVGTAVPLEELK